MGRIRIALCQLDTVVGDVDGNVERVLGALEAADEAGCDIAAFPELSLTGYPPEDLLLKPAFVAANLAGLERGGVRDHRLRRCVGVRRRGRSRHAPDKVRRPR